MNTSDDITPGPYSEDDLRTQWNQQADEFNQWESLDSCEQLAWAQARAIAADRARLRWPILQWTENLPPSQEYCDPIEERLYNHCAAYTPFGRFLVCWRTSKPHIFCIRETPWSAFAVETCDSLETAKAACQQAMNDRLEQWGCAFGQPTSTCKPTTND